MFQFHPFCHLGSCALSIGIEELMCDSCSEVHGWSFHLQILFFGFEILYQRKQ